MNLFYFAPCQAEENWLSLVPRVQLNMLSYLLNLVPAELMNRFIQKLPEPALPVEKNKNKKVFEKTKFWKKKKNKKNRFFFYVTPRLPLVSTTNFSPFGPAVRPARENIYLDYINRFPLYTFSSL